MDSEITGQLSRGNTPDELQVIANRTIVSEETLNSNASNFKVESVEIASDINGNSTGVDCTSSQNNQSSKVVLEDQLTEAIEKLALCQKNSTSTCSLHSADSVESSTSMYFTPENSPQKNVLSSEKPLVQVPVLVNKDSDDSRKSSLTDSLKLQANTTNTSSMDHLSSLSRKDSILDTQTEDSGLGSSVSVDSCESRASGDGNVVSDDERERFIMENMEDDVIVPDVMSGDEDDVREVVDWLLKSVCKEVDDSDEVIVIINTSVFLWN